MSGRTKILSLEKAVAQVNDWKKHGKKVVFSNGCFDILHAGHADYLEKAKALGDYLVMGLNTDDSVSRIKGSLRPIINEEFRAILLSALACVDMVVFFNEDTPFELIKALIPDILVKGKDYEISNIVGADIVLQHGGKVETIELTEGLSTTSIIKKIKQLND
jgi:rfaE bifunctional protein nucleotidyltransferase chain/domain